LRLADGPDEVHRNQIGKLELRRWLNTDPARTGGSGDQLSPAESAAWSEGGLWPRPKDFR
jgi:acyl-CoA dehydrogenase